MPSSGCAIFFLAFFALSRFFLRRRFSRCDLRAAFLTVLDSGLLTFSHVLVPRLELGHPLQQRLDVGLLVGDLHRQAAHVRRVFSKPCGMPPVSIASGRSHAAGASSPLKSCCASAYSFWASPYNAATSSWRQLGESGAGGARRRPWLSSRWCCGAGRLRGLLRTCCALGPVAARRGCVGGVRAVASSCGAAARWGAALGKIQQCSGRARCSPPRNRTWDTGEVSTRAQAQVLPSFRCSGGLQPSIAGRGLAHSAARWLPQLGPRATPPTGPASEKGTIVARTRRLPRS